jgi:uridine kinase
MPIRLIGITGPSGSGKSTLAHALAGALGDAAVFSMDHYYLPLNHLPFAVREQSNFDDPVLLDWPLLNAHVRSLKQGQSVAQPVYSFEHHARKTETVCFEPVRNLIVEGIFALHDPELRDLMDVRVFVAAPDGLCFERRLDRDISERGRTRESVVSQYEATVRPGAEQFILPTEAFAHVVVKGDQHLPLSVEAVINRLPRVVGQ